MNEAQYLFSLLLISRIQRGRLFWADLLRTTLLVRIVTDWWDASSSSQLPNGTAKTIFTLNLPNITIILLNFGLNKWAKLPSLSGKQKKKMGIFVLRKLRGVGIKYSALNNCILLTNRVTAPLIKREKYCVPCEFC